MTTHMDRSRYGVQSIPLSEIEVSANDGSGEVHGSVQDFLDANDPGALDDVVRWVRTAREGQTFHTGGGAATLVTWTYHGRRRQHGHQWSGTELDAVAPLTLREVLTLFPEDAPPEAVIQVAESLEPALRPHTQGIMAQVAANLTRNYHRLISQGARIPARFAPALPAPHVSAPRVSVRTSAERLDELLRVVDSLYREYLLTKMRR